MYGICINILTLEVLLGQFEWKSRDSPTETRLTRRYRSIDSLSFVTPANFPHVVTPYGGWPMTSRTQCTRRCQSIYVYNPCSQQITSALYMIVDSLIFLSVYFAVWLEDVRVEEREELILKIICYHLHTFPWPVFQERERERGKMET